MTPERLQEIRDIDDDATVLELLAEIDRLTRELADAHRAVTVYANPAQNYYIRMAELEAENAKLREACMAGISLLEAHIDHFTEEHGVGWRGEPPALEAMRSALQSAKEKP